MNQIREKHWYITIAKKKWAWSVSCYAKNKKGKKKMVNNNHKKNGRGPSPVTQKKNGVARVVLRKKKLGQKR